MLSAHAAPCSNGGALGACSGEVEALLVLKLTHAARAIKQENCALWEGQAICPDLCHRRRSPPPRPLHPQARVPAMMPELMKLIVSLPTEGKSGRQAWEGNHPKGSETMPRQLLR